MQHNSMPEWWEEDLQRLAQEERDRRWRERRRELGDAVQGSSRRRSRSAAATMPGKRRKAGGGAAGGAVAGGGDETTSSSVSGGGTAAAAAAAASSPDREDEDNEGDRSQCPICLSPLYSSSKATANSSVARTPCSHEFCRPCLVAALLRCGPPRCPLCRRNLAGFLHQLQRSAVVKVDLF